MIKFLLILSVVLLVIWLWRSGRPNAAKRDQQQNQAAPEALEMVRCTFCSVHVPSVDAIQGKNGLYCSADHRQRAEH